jgi:hypothetical protein
MDHPPEERSLEHYLSLWVGHTQQGLQPNEGQELVLNFEGVAAVFPLLFEQLQIDHQQGWNKIRIKER